TGVMVLRSTAVAPLASSAACSARMRSGICGGVQSPGSAVRSPEEPRVCSLESDLFLTLDFRLGALDSCVSGVPQLSQKAAPGRVRFPHAGQRNANRLPHASQNLAPSRFLC